MALAQKNITVDVPEEKAEAIAARRHAKVQRNTPETQSYQRIGRVADLATEVWGNYTDAIDWLSRPNMELKGRTPISLLETSAGEEAVMRLLSALENGFPV